MSDEECREALGSRNVGRAAVQTDSGPQIVPVNYAVDGDSLFFRALPPSDLGRDVCEGTVAFEVDDLDLDRQARWSVLVRGPVVPATAHGRPVADQLRTAGLPRAEGRSGRELFELRVRELSGRWVDPDGDAKSAED
jgi:nitroimidazol reductase NimA-like FMN-containing flavoprotein (pyridoxamine 5'-phosphate oxidase superfamily)